MSSMRASSGPPTERFDVCLARLLSWEGGFVNHPRDPGGATNMGITRRTLSEWLGREATVLEVKYLTPATAGAIYKAQYWREGLPPGPDYAYLDAAVLSGPGQAARWLQRAAGVLVDGAIGPKTLAAVRADPEGAVRGMRNARFAMYRSLPTWDAFGKGWSRRLEDVTALALKDCGLN